jgi:hypothetical protein
MRMRMCCLLQLMERLQNKHNFGLMAVSLGYADTLMSLSAASTSSELSAADKEAADISDGYVRLSVGITGPHEKLWMRCGLVNQLKPDGDVGWLMAPCWPADAVFCLHFTSS